MNLIEVLMAAGLFLGSSAASMLVWSRATAVLVADSERLRRLDDLEAELQAGEARLRDPTQLFASPTADCSDQALRLVAVLDNQPPPLGVVRQIVLPEGTKPMLVRLSAGDVERVRAYNPAAFGGCGTRPEDEQGGG